jgi:tight adherence protein C
MTLVQIAYLVIVFLFIAGIAFMIMRLFAARPTQARLEQLASNKAKTEIEVGVNEYDKWERSISKIVKPFASLSLPSEGWEKSHLRTRFMNAGYRAQSLHYYRSCCPGCY